MDSSANQSFNHSNTGLLRYRSAPSALFDSDSEPGRLFSRFAGYGSELESSPEFRDSDDKSAVATGAGSRRYASSGLPPHYPRQASGSFENGGLGLATSMALESGDQIPRQGKSLGSSLVRQSSSPPGLFAHISTSNGYGELSPSTNRLKSQISFSSRLSSSLGMIPEAESESLGASAMEEEKLGNGNADARFYGNGFTFSSWNEPLNFTENFGGVRRDQESNRKLCSSYQDEELGSRIHVLSHHLSLPKNSGEMAMEKFLHFQDSVPCKVRAKRGCATHPRSIAERVRRTRISERMRKLQELVPNMDKQTNTADMLDLAVDYIKDLQKQFKNLSDNRANCKCLNVQKRVQNQVL